MNNLFKLLLNISICLSYFLTNAQSVGEVTKVGDTWTTTVDGITKYTGINMIDAVNGACLNMGAGTINVRSSGDSGPGNSAIKGCLIQSNQTIDFHGNTMNCTGEPLLVVPVKASDKTNITVKNLNVTGTPRYVIWYTNECKNMTLTNITSNTTRGNGIRIAGTKIKGNPSILKYASNLTINGNINIKSKGHSIETLLVKNVEIDTVYVSAEVGCGVLLNTSENCNINAIYATDCDYGSSYAGFRQANDNGTTHLKYLNAKHCGRGMYTLTGSENVTVDEVDIDDCSESGISTATTAKGVRVLSGTVTNSNKNIDIWNGASDICLNVNNESFGDACDPVYYELVNKNSGMSIAVDGASDLNDTNIIQKTSNNTNISQQFEVSNINGYYFIVNKGSGKALRASGDNVIQFTFDATYWSEMFSRIDAVDGHYLFKNRNTSKCMSVENNSSLDGASIVLQNCDENDSSQQFALNKLNITLSSESISFKNKNYNIYPTITSNNINIDFSDTLISKTKLTVSNINGKKVFSKTLTDKKNELDFSNFSSGIYFLKLVNSKLDETVKIIKQ
ncbi:hypothetical protein BW723_15500 [Polaribacter reichenbachii]|uniref:Uncharacterized protein n=1 Tax=Polaribacter reichenbachii TaxID=996801 RepID=A0A1B8U5C3_9FLAO|nr:RICIN domain-containing protein [Polaribacter reichenbachii]APZ47605.1 hypothetical protein BW723_15500 [Polaribacter reichenbachii]AUC18245.1 hypothetical protein BTO17_05945 [Polaribacter reichenbachii]OBY67043.1 hypothetical protein LPB301_04290 [Polaribacter reichenbachii]